MFWPNIIPEIQSIKRLIVNRARLIARLIVTFHLLL